MRKELEHKLIEEHPLLFADRYKSPYETCMCFGIACGDGWYDILYEACSKIEPLIQKYIEEHPSTKCYTCSCDKSEHESGLTGEMECQKQHYLPYHFGGWFNTSYYVINKKVIKEAFKSWRNFKFFVSHKLWHHGYKRRIKTFFYRKINRFSQWLFNTFNIGYYKHCHCKNFEKIHPRASQIKEKYGSLRFYMTSATDEIYKIIREAERKSEITCENCGQPGELRDNGWLFTFCDECERKS